MTGDHKTIVAKMAAAYDVQAEAPDFYEPARVNGLAPVDVAAVQRQYGDRAVLVGERESFVVLERRAATGGTRAIRVRPAYRPEPRERLRVDHLLPRETDHGSRVGFAIVAVAVIYFGAHVAAAVIR